MQSGVVLRSGGACHANYVVHLHPHGGEPSVPCAGLPSLQDSADRFGEAGIGAGAGCIERRWQRSRGWRQGRSGSLPWHRQGVCHGGSPFLRGRQPIRRSVPRTMAALLAGRAPPGTTRRVSRLRDRHPNLDWPAHGPSGGDLAGDQVARKGAVAMNFCADAPEVAVATRLVAGQRGGQARCPRDTCVVNASASPTGPLCVPSGVWPATNADCCGAPPAPGG